MKASIGPKTCERIFAAHLDEPVAGIKSEYGYCCPLEFVLRDQGELYTTVGNSRRTYRDGSETPLHKWQRRFVILADKRHWSSITGRVALDLLKQAQKETA